MGLPDGVAPQDFFAFMFISRACPVIERIGTDW
jgi:hypothetical protein